MQNNTGIMQRWRQYTVEHFNYLFTLKKYQGIDLLRTLAILFVIYYHTGDIPIFIKSRFISAFLHCGVDLFFVISGFLIGGMIIDACMKDKFSFKKFYTHRALRILPLYYFMVLFSIALNVFILHLAPFSFPKDLKHIFINFIFLQTYTYNNQYYCAGGTWTLVIEEFFYFFAPIVIYGLLRYKKSLKFLFVALVLLALPGILLNFIHPPKLFGYYALPHRRYFELIMGVLATIIARQWPNKINPKIYFFTGLAMVLGIYFWEHDVHGIINFKIPPFDVMREPITMWYPVLISIAFSLITLAIYNINIKSFIRYPIAFFANISYSLYLWHFIALEHAPSLTALFPMMLIGAYILSYALEYPCLRLYRNKPKPVISEPTTVMPPLRAEMN